MATEDEGVTGGWEEFAVVSGGRDKQEKRGSMGGGWGIHQEGRMSWHS